LFIEKTSQHDDAACDAAGLLQMRQAQADCPMWLCHKIGRKEHVVESVSTKDDLMTLASSELIDGLKDLIPGVFRHEVNERVQTANCLLIEVVENGRCKGIGMMMFCSYRINFRSRF
jgi:hypothetical protein